MYSRTIKALCLVCLLAAGVFCALPAAAQSATTEKPVVYTYVSEWGVPRAMWGDYMKAEDSDTDLLKKAVADGTLLGYGNYATLNHQEGQPTHGSWFSASSMANLMKVLESLRTRPDATAPALAASKHWDYIMQSRDYSARPGTFTNGYLRVGTWKMKSGGADADKIIRASFLPVLEKLVSSGALYAYQIDNESVHSADPNLIFVVIIANGAEGLDKFYAAIDDFDKNNSIGSAAFDSLIDPAGHRDFLAKVSSFTRK